MKNRTDIQLRMYLFVFLSGSLLSTGISKAQTRPGRFGSPTVEAADPQPQKKQPPKKGHKRRDKWRRQVEANQKRKAAAKHQSAAKHQPAAAKHQPVKPQEAEATQRLVPNTSSDKSAQPEPYGLDALKKEVAQLRAELEASHLLSSPPKPKGLTSEQIAQRATYKTRLKTLAKQQTSIEKAIAGGLDPKIVEQQLSDITKEIEALNRAIIDLEAEGKASAKPTPTVCERADKLEKQLAAVQSELAELRASQKREQDSRKAADKAESEEQDSMEKSLFAEIGQVLPIKLFAFGDFLFAYRQNGDDGFEIGQLELDLNQTLGENVSVSVAVAYDSDSAGFGVGAYTIDGHLAGKGAEHLFQTDFVETSGIVFGRFDVPFGIDYLSYASIERRLVTRPIAVEQTHDAWNDLGGQFYLDADVFNMVFFVVNGFGYVTEADPPQGEDEPLNIHHKTDVAFGSRLGARPIKQLEFGGSAAGFFSQSEGGEMLLAGGDLALHIQDFVLKGEYIFHLIGLSQDEMAWNHGVYGTVMYDFKPVFASARYSIFIPDKRVPEYGFGDSPFKQLSFGIGVAVLENAEIRLEYMSTLEKEGNGVFIQLAGGAAWQPTGLRR